METVAAAPAVATNWAVFVLRNPADRFFVGHTDDLPGFLSAADANVAIWTGQPGPWPLVWKHEGLTEAAARKYEISLKRDKNTPRFFVRTGVTPPLPPAESTATIPTTIAANASLELDSIQPPSET